MDEQQARQLPIGAPVTWDRTDTGTVIDKDADALRIKWDNPAFTWGWIYYRDCARVTP